MGSGSAAQELEAGQPGSAAGRAVGVGAVDRGLGPVLALSVARTLALVPVHLVERAAAPAPAPSRVRTQALARSAPSGSGSTSMSRTHAQAQVYYCLLLQ